MPSSKVPSIVKTVKKIRVSKVAKEKPKTVLIGDVEVMVATPAGRPKNRSAAAIRAAVRAHVNSAK